MTEPPTDERLARIRERADRWSQHATMSKLEAGQQFVMLLAEVDRQRAEMATVNAKLSHLADLHRSEQNARYEVVGLLNTMWNGTVNAPTRERILRVLSGVTPAVPEPLTPASPCSDCGLPLAAHAFAVCTGKPAAVLPALPKDDRGATQAAEVAPCGCPVHHHRMRVTKHTHECSRRIGAAEFDAGYEPDPDDEPTPDAAPVVAEEAPVERPPLPRRGPALVRWDENASRWRVECAECSYTRDAVVALATAARLRDEHSLTHAAPAVGPAATDGQVAPVDGPAHVTEDESGRWWMGCSPCEHIGRLWMGKARAERDRDEHNRTVHGGAR